MLLEAPKPTAAHLAEIARLEAEAQRAREAKERSFQRCDTDGFLSQWAHGMTAQKADMQKQILKNGGYARFLVLCDEDGNVVADREYRFKNPYTYGVDCKWRLPDDLAEEKGRKWIPVGANSRVQKQLGLHEESRWFPARAAIAGEGTGLSGCANAYVTAERIMA
jgi:hypothetical protein